MRPFCQVPLVLLAIWMPGRAECGRSSDQELSAAPPAAAVAAEWSVVKRTQPHMGTRFEITVCTQDRVAAEVAIQAALARIAQLDQRLSDYRAASELNQVSAAAPHAQPRSVSDDLFRVLQNAHALSVASDGAFDVTIGPLSRLWRKARRTGRWPSEAALAEARRPVGFGQLELRPPNQIRMLQAGMRLDVGGIAKGDALDEALRTLRQAGFPRALVNGGGDVVAGDPPPNKLGWQVAVAGLAGAADAKKATLAAATNADVTTLVLARQAVATSGDLWQAFEHEGVRYSHIIDPRTGRGVTRQSSATVVASTASLADGWASALSVLGPAAIERLESRGIEACLVFRLPDSRAPRAASQTEAETGRVGSVATQAAITHAAVTQRAMTSGWLQLQQHSARHLQQSRDSPGEPAAEQN